jgi:hypothetical protein
MPKDKTIVTTASVTKVKNDKKKRKSRSTFESENRISKKVTNGGNIKRKSSATLQDDGSLVIAVNTSRKPVGRKRTINKKNRAAKKLERMTNRFNKQQDRFINKIS